MNMQEILDFTFEKLWNQNKLSYIKGQGCKYRGPDGTKCGIGWLIPDEEYCAAMEGFGYLHAFRMMTHLEFKDQKTLDFFGYIQNAHDNCLGIDNFRDGLKTFYLNIATLFDLDKSFIETFK